MLAVIAWISGASFAIPVTPSCLGVLAYLTVIGSVIGFTTYPLMVARIGADRAAYATVPFPAVALILSTLFEGYVWHTTALVGGALNMLGNLVMFANRPICINRRVS